MCANANEVPRPFIPIGRRKQSRSCKRLIRFRTRTTMTACPRFPPEISVYIVDIVHSGGQAEALRRCCLVSKSWVPRTRKHIFCTVEFWGSHDVGAWKRKKVFPNPSNSPAHYARSLFFGTVQSITDVVAEGGGWI